jgi:hypothetical protein
VREDDFGPVRDVHQRLDRVLIEIHGDRLQAAGMKDRTRTARKTANGKTKRTNKKSHGLPWLS